MATGDRKRAEKTQLSGVGVAPAESSQPGAMTEEEMAAKVHSLENRVEILERDFKSYRKQNRELIMGIKRRVQTLENEWAPIRQARQIANRAIDAPRRAVKNRREMKPIRQAQQIASRAIEARKRAVKSRESR